MKRIGKGGVRACAAGMILCLALIGAWFLARGAQRPLAGFDDLRAERLPLADGKNFKKVLDEAEALLPNKLNAVNWLNVSRELEYRWDEEKAASILAQSEAARACVKAGLNRCEGYADTELVNGKAGYLITLFDCGGKRFALAYALKLAFDQALERGDAEGAYGQVLDLFREIDLLQNGPAGLADLKSVSVWLSCGMKCCERLAHRAECKDEWLAEMLRRLPRRADIVRAETLALKGEFSRQLSFTGKYSTWSEFLFPACLPMAGAQRAERLMNSFLDLTYSPAATCRLMADAVRDAIRVVQSERVGMDLRAEKENVFRVKTGADLMRLNAGGRIVDEHTRFYILCFVRRMKAAEARAECLRAVLACERCRRATGAYPATLEALVPRFLESVPQDPYAGAPLRYSAEKEIVWSAGENRVDDGGSTNTEKGAHGRFGMEDSAFALDLVWAVSPSQYAAAQEAKRRWHLKGHAKN